MTEHERPPGSIRPGFGREDWNERYRGAELLWTAEPNRLLAAQVVDLPVGRALDVACGEGRNAIWLAQQGWDVTAVDFSEVALGKAAQLAASRGVEVEWVLEDVLRYEPEPLTFDLVVVLYLQLPVAELAAALRGAANAVAPGGTLLVLGHDSTNLTEGYGGPKDASVLFTPDDVIPLLAGLVVERAETVERIVSLSDRDAVALDALVCARRPDAHRRLPVAGQRLS
jgi:SAM-dependent methyltransferase